MVSWRRSLVLVVAVGLLAGCGGGGEEPSAVTVAQTTPTSTTTTESTTTTVSAEAAVEQAFYEQWDAFIEILSDPDPANPLIDRYFTGRARETLLDTISSDVRNGYVTRRPEDPQLFRPTIVRIVVDSDTTARVEECLVDGLVLMNAGTGEVVNDAVITSEITNTFVREGGTWKLEHALQRNRVEGVGGCAGH